VRLLQEQLLALINRQLTANAWAKDRLSVFAGQTAHIVMAPFAFRIAIQADGSLMHVAGDPAEGVADPANTNADVTTIDIPLAAFPALARGELSAMRHVRIRGNAGLAQEIALIAREFPVDIESEVAYGLRRILPAHAADTLATMGGKVSRAGRAWAADATQRAAANVSEYLIHEQPTVTDRYAVEEFAERLERLRERVDRLDKRIRLVTANAPFANTERKREVGQ
jgi:ubiquinone biosynthesis accessory factor UbiJ